MTQPITPSATQLVHENVTFKVSLEPLPPHMYSIAEYYDGWQNLDASGLDLPNTFEEFKGLSKEADAIESMGVAAYRAVVLRPMYPRQTRSNEDSKRNANSSPNRVAGIICFQLPDQLDDTAVLGTWLFKPFQGTGLNAIAKQLMIRFAYEVFQCSTILWLISETNMRAIRASDKLPFARRVPNEELMHDLLAYKKWHEFKTGWPSVLYLVTTNC